MSKKAEEEFLYYSGSRGAGAPSAPLAASVTATDLGFRCRGAEHLLLLLDTRKTSFIAKNFRGE
jgi:hypothetical protein